MVLEEKEDNEIEAVMVRGTGREPPPVSTTDNVDPNFGDAPWLVWSSCISAIANFHDLHLKSNWSSFGRMDNFVDRDVGFCCFWPCRKAPERKPFCERLPPEAPAPQGPASPSSPSKEATYDDVALPSNVSTRGPSQKNQISSPGASNGQFYDDVNLPLDAPTGESSSKSHVLSPSASDSHVYDDVALPHKGPTRGTSSKKRALSPGASHSYSYDGVTVPPKAPTGRPLPELPNDVSAVDESVYDDVQVPSVDAPAGYPLKKKASALDVSQGPSEAIYEELDSPKKQTSKN